MERSTNGGCRGTGLAGSPDQADLAACPAHSHLSGLAAELEALVGDVRNRLLEGSAGNPAVPAEEARRAFNSEELTLGIAKRLYRDRRRRGDMFDADLFGEPAWDMLLDLYIAACEDRQVSTTSACIGANVPVATGLRWIQLLENQGLIARKADPRDARRVWISLTANARRSLRSYFAASIQQAGRGSGTLSAAA
ncbi:helix-turn-helix domain-containing protein [Novosphingobium huizhouense]|uniref:MarR family transcriptional regulator n=1 Tax=Novosphingobium huizhouense TaxID=2866625 RepID=UPI001CD8EC0D|nr:MarR family transcriptional regulator [Novosphingobium huizhouense]